MKRFYVMMTKWTIISRSDPFENAAINDQNEINNNDICLICGEFGRDGEMWYRCTSCSHWAHADCSGSSSAKGYVCDNCRPNFNTEKVKRNLRLF